MSERLPVRFYEHEEGPLHDLQQLPSDEARKVALWWLKRVERNPRLGLLLQWQQSTGDLSDCRKIYFEERDEPWNVAVSPKRSAGEERARFRIVYRLRPSEARPEYAEVVAIGPKRYVYVSAARRLGRL